MVARNDVTGDALRSRTLTKEGEDNWDRIFGKKKDSVGETQPTTDKPVEPIQLELDFGDEYRMDIIGQNGNDGTHYK